MTPLDLERLTRRWQPGERCVAAYVLTYCTAEHPDVPHGTRGTVRAVLPAGVLRVRWDGFPGAPEVPTGPDCVDPLPE